MTDRMEFLHLQDMNEKSEENDLSNGLLNHILLPRFLPQQLSENLCYQELELLSRFVNEVELLNEWIPSATIDVLRKFLNVQRNVSADTIYYAINNLKPGQTFSILIRGQNCMLMIYMPDCNKVPVESTPVIVATFASGSPPDGSSINNNIGDLEVI